MRFINLIFVFVLCAVASNLRSDAPKVPVDIYYEVDCPGCAVLILYTLKDHMENAALANITDLHLYPYGNAKTITRDPPTFVCQHGENECRGNMLELCGMKHYPTTYFPFILCAERIVTVNDEEATRCAEETGLDVNTILSCFNGPEALLLHLECGDATPAHDSVPLLMVNHVIVKDTNSLSKEVCDAYEGVKPEVCKNL
ncbi:hypothetical protein WA158_004677 [Blastocystis sp. Blastoise]